VKKLHVETVEANLLWQLLNLKLRVRNKEHYCTVGSASSGAPCRRNNCGKF